MKTSRRTFLKTGAMAVAGVAILRKPVFASGMVPRIVGVQLYCIRDEMEKDPLGSLKQVAEMGYVHLEHASYNDRKFYGWTATEFKKVLDDLGSVRSAPHVSSPAACRDRTGEPSRQPAGAAQPRRPSRAALPRWSSSDQTITRG